jgi:3-isopropylmalate/(R)-2-methylmalate dehydratase small subunit
MARAWVFGENIDTDMLAPGQFMKFGIAEIARHCLAAVNPGFAAAVRPGDIVVGGRNFGMGSSREQAPQALRHLGVAAVIAPSFGGIFYRNAINLGLAALVCPEIGSIAQDDDLAVDPAAGRILNRTRGIEIPCEPVPGHLMALLQAGGLLAYLEARLARAPQAPGTAR